jgi:DNA-binding NarL/FixJ family response regulator
MKALTDEQIAEARQLYRTGHSTSEIAAQYYVCRTTIWHYVNDIKVRQKPQQKKCKKVLTEEKIAEVRRLYRQGYSTYMLAEQYYVCRSTIWLYVKDIRRGQRLYRQITRRPAACRV